MLKNERPSRPTPCGSGTNVSNVSHAGCRPGSRMRGPSISSWTPAIRRLPINVSKATDEWWLWWVPLRHVGGKPYTVFSVHIDFDRRRSCNGRHARVLHGARVKASTRKYQKPVDMAEAVTLNTRCYKMMTVGL